jgi:hypothetical protein
MSPYFDSHLALPTSLATQAIFTELKLPGVKSMLDVTDKQNVPSTVALLRALIKVSLVDPCLTNDRIHTSLYGFLSGS